MLVLPFQLAGNVYFSLSHLNDGYVFGLVKCQCGKQQVLSEEKFQTEIQNAKVSLSVSSDVKSCDTKSTHTVQSLYSTYRTCTERRLYFFCLNLVNSHNDAFAFPTLQYCMSLNNSAFIYCKRMNNVTPKSFTSTSPSVKLCHNLHPKFFSV